MASTKTNTQNNTKPLRKRRRNRLLVKIFFVSIVIFSGYSFKFGYIFVKSTDKLRRHSKTTCSRQGIQGHVLRHNDTMASTHSTKINKKIRTFRTFIMNVFFYKMISPTYVEFNAFHWGLKTVFRCRTLYACLTLNR